MYKIIVAFSIEAQSIADEHGGLSKLKAFPKEVKKGYDWNEKLFDTKEQVESYVDGLADGNGWSREPAYEWGLLPPKSPSKKAKEKQL